MTITRFFAILKRRSLVVFCVIAAGLAVMYSFRNALPSSFAGVSHVVLVAENGSRDPSVGIVDLPSIATSTVVLERVRRSQHLTMPLVSLKGNVSASVLGRSSIMAIGFRDQSSETAIAVSNSVADELSRYYNEISTHRYDVNVDRLSDALSTQTAKMRTLDQAMNNVVATNPYVVTDRSIDNITSQMGLLQAQRAETAAQLIGDQELAATTAASPGLSATAEHEILTGDPTYQAVRTAAAKDSAQLESDRAGYTNNFPGLQGAVAKVNAETEAVQQAASRALSNQKAYSPSAASTAAQHLKQLAAVAGDKARLQQLDDLIAKDQSNLGAVPTTGGTFAQLRAQRDALQTEYNVLATRRANALANRAEASSLGSVVVLDRAIKADTQLASGRTRAAMVALILTLALAIGAAFLVEALDPRIRRAEEIEELYGIPVVGNVGVRS
jgi:capsular polysaccharide biosynthesis protein